MNGHIVLLHSAHGIWIVPMFGSQEYTVAVDIRVHVLEGKRSFPLGGPEDSQEWNHELIR